MFGLARVGQTQQVDFLAGFGQAARNPGVDFFLGNFQPVSADFAQQLLVISDGRQTAGLAPAPLTAFGNDSEQRVAHGRTVGAAPVIVPTAGLGVFQFDFEGFEAEVFFPGIDQHILRAEIEPVDGLELGLDAFDAASNLDDVAEIPLAEDFIHQAAQVMEFVVIDADENHAILGQQVAQQFQARGHHAQPFVVAGQVVLAHFAAQPILHQRAVDVVIIGPGFVAGVVGRVDVNALHPSAIERQQGLEGQQVVAFHNQVSVRFLRLEGQFGNGLQRMVGDGQVVVPEDMLAFEL